MKVLVVDDEKRLAESLADYLGQDGVDCEVAYDGAAGRARLMEDSFDVVATDLRMPGLDGLALLRWLRDEGPQVPVIMMSAHGEVRDAVEAMRLGAYDYLVKPFDPDELLIRLRKAAGERRSARLIAAGASRFSEGARMVGESEAIAEAKRLIAKAAPAAATVLITGESGTGKEVAARMVHEASGREGPFVAVNLGALPDQLVESELFGYEKGAFTGADQRKAGLIETAQGGTIFLDEIGELPLHLQVKLLRAIQDKRIQRIGAVKSLPVDARLVAATNRDLEAEVAAGRFREDLYYRLNVIRLRMPPLRERDGDIPLLAGYFLKKLSAELGRRIEGISPEALAVLEGHSFPGNVRELENAMERAIILAEGDTLGPRDFAALAGGGQGRGQRREERRGGPAGAADEPPATLAEIERRAIVASLERNEYHRERTAAELGIARRTLLNKIKDYDIRTP